MSIVIRAAVPSDSEGVARLCHELNIHQEEPADAFTPEAMLQDGFGLRAHFNALVAEVDGEIVGFALFHEAYETSYAAPGFYLSELYVSERARASGVGRKLVAALAAEAKKRDRSFLWWVSKDWNEEAQVFYQNLGAEHEPMMAHTVHGDAFERLAEEAMTVPDEIAAE